MVHVGQRAGFVLVGGEVRLEPPPLRRGSLTASWHLLAVAVEGDEVPGPYVEGVVALLGVSGGLPEVLEVPLGSLRVVVVVAGGGLGAALEAAPGGLVALLEVLGRPVRVGVVAKGEHRGAVDATDEPGGGIVALPAAIGYVARRDDDLPGRRRPRGQIGRAHGR